MKRRTFLGVLPFVGGLFAARKGFFEAIGEPSGPGVAIGSRAPAGFWRCPYQDERNRQINMQIEVMAMDPSPFPNHTVIFQEMTLEEFKRRYPGNKAAKG